MSISLGRWDCRATQLLAVTELQMNTPQQISLLSGDSTKIDRQLIRAEPTAPQKGTRTSVVTQNGKQRTSSGSTSPSSSAPMLTREEDTRWAMLSHFGAVAGCLPALIIHLLLRERGPFTAQESKEALNFTLPLTVVMLVFYGLAFVPSIAAIAGISGVVVWAYMAISGIIGGAECNKGRPYRYPLNLRLIR